MIKKLVRQLEKLEERSLDENIQLCGKLEAEAKKRQRFRQIAWAIHLLFLPIGILVFFGLVAGITVIENGQGAILPPLVRQLLEFVMENAVFLVISPILPQIVIDIILSIFGRLVPAGNTVRETKEVLGSSDVEKKLKYLEDSLTRAEERLEFKLLTFSKKGGARLLHGLCIVLSLVIAGIAVFVGEDPIECLWVSVMMFLSFELMFLIASLPMTLLFRNKNQIYTIKSKLRKYKDQARLEAMTPEERRAYDLEQERKAEEHRRLEEETRRRKAREAEELRDFLARKRCVCQYNNAGICNHNSTPYVQIPCKYLSNPFDCMTALMANALLFLDK